MRIRGSTPFAITEVTVILFLLLKDHILTRNTRWVFGLDQYPRVCCRTKRSRIGYPYNVVEWYTGTRE